MKSDEVAVIEGQLTASTEPILSHLHHNILEGLGKNRSLTQLQRSPGPLVHAWLSDRAPKHAIIADFPYLTPSFQEHALEILTMHGIEVWCAIAWPVDDGSRDQRRMIERAEAALDRLAERLVKEWNADIVPLDGLPEAATDVEPISVRPRFPAIPTVDGLVFRSTCQALLDPSDFEIVDTRFVALVNEIRAEIRSADNFHKLLTFRKQLRNRIEIAPSTEELVLSVRAAQVAALTAGWLVKVDTTALAVGAETMPRVGLADHEDWWHRLRAYRDPDFGAVLALHIAGLETDAIGALRTSDITITDQTVHITGHSETAIEIVHGTEFVRVQHHLAELVSENPDPHLFFTHRGPSLTSLQVFRTLTAPTTELGISTTVERLGVGRRDDPKYLARYGIEIIGHSHARQPRKPSSSQDATNAN